MTFQVTNQWLRNSTVRDKSVLNCKISKLHYVTICHSFYLTVDKCACNIDIYGENSKCINSLITFSFSCRVNIEDYWMDGDVFVCRYLCKSIGNQKVKSQRTC